MTIFQIFNPPASAPFVLFGFLKEDCVILLFAFSKKDVAEIITSSVSVIGEVEARKMLVDLNGFATLPEDTIRDAICIDKYIASVLFRNIRAYIDATQTLYPIGTAWPMVKPEAVSDYCAVYLTMADHQCDLENAILFANAMFITGNTTDDLQVEILYSKSQFESAVENSSILSSRISRELLAAMPLMLLPDFSEQDPCVFREEPALLVKSAVEWAYYTEVLISTWGSNAIRPKNAEVAKLSCLVN